MNAAFNLSRLIRLCGVVAIFSALAACGQRGPLYLPAPLLSKAPAKPVTAPANQNATPTEQKPDATPDSTQGTEQK